MHLLKLLLGQHQAVHLFLSGGARDGDPANERGPSLLLFLGLEKNVIHHYAVLKRNSQKNANIDLP